MVTIEQQPEPVSLAGNPVVYQVCGGQAFLPGSREKARAALSFNSEMSENMGFCLTVNQEQYRFIAVRSTTVPDDACQLLMPSGATKMDVVEIGKQMALHPFFAPRFRFEVDVPTQSIRMESVDYEYYVMQLWSFAVDEETGEDYSKKYIGFIQETQGGMPVLRDEYALYRNVCVLDGDGNEILVASDRLSVDNEGRNRNDIGEYLHPYFHFDLHYPPRDPYYLQPGIFLPYRCYFYESCSGLLSRMTAGEVRYALPGRLSAIDYSLRRDTENGIGSGLGYRFLSNYKGVKTLYQDYPEKLFFLFPENLPTGRIYLRASGKKSDGSFFSVQVGNDIWVAGSRLVEFDLSWPILKAACGDNVVACDICIAVSPLKAGVFDWTPFSEVRQYRIEHNPPANLHCFFFMNAWGVPEVAVLRGSKKTELEISRDINSIRGEEAADSPISVRIDKLMTVGSGYITEHEWTWLCEMQRSLQVFELLENRILACTLTNKKSADLEEHGLRSHEFTYKYTQKGSVPFEGGFSYRYIFDTTFNETFN